MAEPTDSDLARLLNEIADALTSSMTQLVGTVGSLRAAGVAQEQIANRVIADTRAGAGWVAPFAGTVKARAEQLQQQVYLTGQTNILTADDADPELLWNAVLSDSCPDCVDRHGDIKTLSEWQALGLPGQGSTVCRYHCRCTLIPVDRAKRLYRATSDADLTKKARSVLVDRAAEIKRIEKERGKDFAASTFNAKLGQARQFGNPLRFRP